MEKRKWTRQEVEAWLNENRRWFYRNKADANLFVRKRCWGINWALNWGHPLAWAFLAGFLALLAAVIAAGTLLF